MRGPIALFKYFFFFFLIFSPHNVFVLTTIFKALLQIFFFLIKGLFTNLFVIINIPHALNKIILPQGFYTSSKNVCNNVDFLSCFKGLFKQNIFNTSNISAYNFINRPLIGKYKIFVNTS